MSSGTITAAEQQAIDERIHARRWFTLATLCLSLLIIVMDNTILNVAIPSLVRDLGATNSQLQWIVDGYTLVFAGLLLTAGSLGDRCGRKRALRIGIVIFAIGSVLSALAGSPQHLISTRCADGRRRGADHALHPVDPDQRVPRPPRAGPGHRHLGRLLRPRRRPRPGHRRPPAAALLLELGLLGQPADRDRRTDPRLLLRARVEGPERPPPRPARRAAEHRRPSAFLLFAIIEGPDAGWTSASVLGAFAIGLAALVGFIVWELHTDHPMLDMSFFKNPRFSAANTAITLTLLRHVRLAVPDDPVLAVRARLLAPPGRRAADPVRRRR